MKVNKSLYQQVLSTEVDQRHLVFMCHEFSDVASKKPLRLSSTVTLVFRLTKYGYLNHFWIPYHMT